MDYKATLLLPKTDFPMRAELPKREPAMLARWRKEKIYDRILAARRGAKKFVLHDGPPFANGDAHMGHALNMVLKDIVLKVQNMSGREAPFVPGWDCHGLPIEFKVMKELGAAETDPLRIREKCEATARHFVAVQSEQFQRLGIFGDWDHPYLTLDPAYEAETLRVFASLVGKDLVYEGLRPVLWSTGCQTALAEAEIEYKEKIDPAVYVKFWLTVEAGKKLPELMDTALLVWTTTPWTLPANLAVAVAPNLEYAVYQIAGNRVLLHTNLVEKLPAAELILRQAQDDGTKVAQPIAGPWKGSELVGLTYEHPFLDDGKKRQVYAADFVTADAGTGLVHIAPGHGPDDYQLGMEHGLPVLAPVDDRGCLTAEFLPDHAGAEVEGLVGQYVFKANPLIIDILRNKGALYAEEEYRHDYPYCWRSKTPIVTRAVKQWFIKVDAFRADALVAIDGVKWIPESGRNRIRGAVESRPDWCISRQRTWGIPLPVFYGEGGQPLMNEKTIRAFADLVEKQGAGIWFSRTSDELARDLNLPSGLQKGRDTLDVWIDSGTSWAAVAQKRPELSFPADLYLEGSDQHRGWFQSSLLTSVATMGQAPYRAVLTNGFVVDIEGKKLSKSGTGYQKPVDLMTLVNEHGADVLRLWVASQKYEGDIPFSKEIFARINDSYRSLRNTLRILLANLVDFDVTRDAVDPNDWTEIDIYIEARYRELASNVRQSYAAYNFADVFHSIIRFCAVDLSSLYVDVLKDRMYCDDAGGLQRRASQTVIHRVVTGLVKLLAPLIPFTAEEAATFLGLGDSIHLQRLPNDEITRDDRDLFKKWERILDLRAKVNEKLEEARSRGGIGKSLEACVEIGSRQVKFPGSRFMAAELFIVSEVTINEKLDDTITVTRAEDHGFRKCVRCWRYYPPEQMAGHADHPDLCKRCTDVVLNFGS